MNRGAVLRRTIRHEPRKGGWLIVFVLFGSGVALILAALWNRGEGDRALILFAIGAVLVMAGGLTAVSGLDLELNP